MDGVFVNLWLIAVFVAAVFWVQGTFMPEPLHGFGERPLQATKRFETAPGVQAKIDWKESMTLG